jgi:hypothetical protein
MLPVMTICVEAHSECPTAVAKEYPFCGVSSPRLVDCDNKMVDTLKLASFIVLKLTSLRHDTDCCYLVYSCMPLRRVWDTALTNINDFIVVQYRSIINETVLIKFVNGTFELV